jgi:hypothetical protein
MKAGDMTHPMGAMAVKELYDGGKLIGWAALAKSKDTGNEPGRWFYFQTRDMTDATKADSSEWGSPMCDFCHTPDKGIILSGYPLRKAVDRVDPSASPTDVKP